MRNLWMAAGLFFGTAALIACDSGTQEQTTTGTVDTELNTTAATDTTLSEDKREFMGYAYNTSNLQVEMGRLAVEKGRTDQVKEYGQRMIDLHTRKQEELQDMSAQYGVTLPQNMTDDQTGRIQELRDTDPEKFDRAYWDSVIDAHKDAVDEFEDNTKDITETDNTTFNTWARTTAKEVRAQMEQAMKRRQDLKS